MQKLKSTNPKVSIIIPSYNHSKFIGKAIESVLYQTYENFELLIIDDASPDNSVDVIKKYEDPRIKFYGFETNQGAVDTLNHGIINSSSEYIALLNSDDYWEIDKLEKQVHFLEESDSVDCVFSDANFIDEAGRVLSKTDYFWADAFTQNNKSSGQWLKQLFYKLNCFCHPSMLIKKEVYNEVGLYDPSLRQLPDFSMWINVIKKFNIHVMEEKLVNFRILSNEMNTSSVTYENRIRNKNELFIIMSNFFDEIKDEDFVEGFLDESNALYTKEEIECEKAFAYLKEISPDIKPIYVLIGLRKLSILLKNENTRRVLKEKYNFSANDFFAYTGKLDIIDVFETSFHQVVVESAKRKIQKDTNLYSTIRKFFKK
ncbi:glycosyltransferase [Paenibacillus sp. FSL H7-0941]|uniref:glycosyltransferase n=1 Tax=Paenibacillus sp. FSL H7-0941 TaxID=2975351 RepID=UPI0030FA3116